MIRRSPRATKCRSSAASDGYKGQRLQFDRVFAKCLLWSVVIYDESSCFVNNSCWVTKWKWRVKSEEWRVELGGEYAATPKKHKHEFAFFIFFTEVLALSSSVVHEASESSRSCTYLGLSCVSSLSNCIVTIVDCNIAGHVGKCVQSSGSTHGVPYSNLIALLPRFDVLHL